MKKWLWLVSVVLVIMILFGACGGNEAEPTPSLNEDDNTDYSQTQIGFSLGGTGAFYDQLKTDIEQLCAKLGYKANIVTADNSAKQQRDIRSMLSAGVIAVVIDPVDVDALESALAECESEDVPVINIIDAINGKVDTLVSPDYIYVGKTAGERAAALFPDGNGRCLELKSDYDSFIMQLMSDGFLSAVEASSKISLVSESYCGSDEEEAYSATKAAINEKDINFIFAQNAVLARGALRAVDESGKDIKLVVYGGDMDIIKAVQSGKVDAAMFFGTKLLADIALGVADEAHKSVTYEPNLYIEVKIDIVTQENVSAYVSDTLSYAQSAPEAA